MRALLFVLLLGLFAFADEASDYAFTVEPIVPTDELVPEPLEPVNASEPVVDVGIDTIIAIGKFAWQFVKDNAPSIHTKTDWAGAVPKGVSWTKLTGFRDKTWGSFGWYAKNMAGMVTVDFKYKYSWTCKGRYRGHGAFIVNAGVSISKIYAAWGYTVNAHVSVGHTPANYGTKVNPIAGLKIKVSINIKTVIKAYYSEVTVLVRGDCTAKKIA